MNKIRESLSLYLKISGKRLVIHLFILLWGNLKKIIQLNRICLDEWIQTIYFRSPGILSWLRGGGREKCQRKSKYTWVWLHTWTKFSRPCHTGMTQQRWYQVSYLGSAQPFCLKIQNLPAHTVSICSRDTLDPDLGKDNFTSCCDVPISRKWKKAGSRNHFLLITEWGNSENKKTSPFFSSGSCYPDDSIMTNSERDRKSHQSCFWGVLIFFSINVSVSGGLFDSIYSGTDLGGC